MDCRDSYPFCPNSNACNTQVVYGGQVWFIYELCKRTCQRCRPLTCNDAPTICENGGTCVSRPVSSNGLFAFGCVCPSGFMGEYCEKSVITNPCASNPCKNGGSCYSVTSSLYICICTGSCTGYNCAECQIPIPQLQPTIQQTTTIAPIQILPSVPDCVDETKLCKIFSKLCNQDYYYYQKTIKQACPETCNSCQTTPSSCQDQDSNCGDFKYLCFWFDSNYYSGGWLSHPCYRTCGHC